MSDLRKLAQACLQNSRAQIDMPDGMRRMEIKIMAVLGLLDEHERDQCEIARLNELLACFVPGPQTDAINQLIRECAAPLVAERDEAREAVRRLAGALDDIASQHNGQVGDWARTALADPVVRRIVEGG